MTATPMLPVHVQRLEDASIGAALRRVRETLPEGCYLSLTLVRETWTATAGAVLVPAPSRTERGTDLEDVLVCLSDGLREALHVHQWRQNDQGQQCLGCGAER